MATSIYARVNVSDKSRITVCKNPAAFGCKSCRYHGARKILSGLQHPSYKAGTRTLEALSNYSQKVAEMDQLERLGHKYGFMAGPKRRGRKPVVD